MKVTAKDILAARQRSAGIVAPTPLELSRPLSAQVGAPVWLKLECAQITGSFKLRGAANALAGLPAERPVVACSAGNHGLGLAHAAECLGRNATVVVPQNAMPAKIAALRRYPVQLILHGQSYDAAEAEAQRLARDVGMHFVSPYNDPAIIAGQGTLACELLEQLVAQAAPQATTLLVPVGGGGLISGVALWAKALDPQVRIIGVQPEVSAVMAASLRAGRMVSLADDQPSLADGLAGGVDPTTITFAIVQQLVERIITVSEAQIAAAMRWLLDEHHLVVEGSGAVGVAALLNGIIDDLVGQRVVVILTGRNVTTDILLSDLGS